MNGVGMHDAGFCAQFQIQPFNFEQDARYNDNNIVIFVSHFLRLLCRKSAPKFLLDVYKQLNDEANGGSGRYARSADTDEGENFITDIDKRAIEQSDIIMTFLNQST